MIAGLAVSVLVPAGVTAGAQAGPACLPVRPWPGRYCPLTVPVPRSISECLAPVVTPARGRLPGRSCRVGPDARQVI